MTNQTIYIQNGAPDQGDGSKQKPFPSLTHAANAHANKEHYPSNTFVDIILGQNTQLEKPTLQLCVDVKAGGPDGDGSDLAPFPNLSAALIYIHEKQHAKEGQIVRLKMREVFTSSSYEQTRDRKEKIAKYTFMAMAAILVLPVFLILGTLVEKAWPSLHLGFLLDNPTNGMTAGGIWAPLIGTFFLVLITLLLSAPIGILAGVYLNEYAKDNWFNRLVNLAVINLAGVPSIVHGLFGVGAFVLFAGMGLSLISASATLAVMTLPVIITSTKEALASVPIPFREACWNLGATRWQTIRTIVLPNSISGILTGVILQVSRAAGETAPILFTGAVFYKHVEDSGFDAFFPYALDDKFMALSYHLFTITENVPNVSESIQFGTAVVLIGMVLAVNSVSIAFRFYLRSRKKW